MKMIGDIVPDVFQPPAQVLPGVVSTYKVTLGSITEDQ
jgi:hypothetical protein